MFAPQADKRAGSSSRGPSSRQVCQHLVRLLFAPAPMGHMSGHHLQRSSYWLLVSMNMPVTSLVVPTGQSGQFRFLGSDDGPPGLAAAAESLLGRLPMMPNDAVAPNNVFRGPHWRRLSNRRPDSPYPGLGAYPGAADVFHSYELSTAFDSPGFVTPGSPASSSDPSTAGDEEEESDGSPPYSYPGSPRSPGYYNGPSYSPTSPVHYGGSLTASLASQTLSHTCYVPSTVFSCIPFCLNCIVEDCFWLVLQCTFVKAGLIACICDCSPIFPACAYLTLVIQCKLPMQPDSASDSFGAAMLVEKQGSKTRFGHS